MTNTQPEWIDTTDITNDPIDWGTIEASIPLRPPHTVNPIPEPGSTTNHHRTTSAQPVDNYQSCAVIDCYRTLKYNSM